MTYTYPTVTGTNNELRSDAAASFERMQDASHYAGDYITSGYRSHEEQVRLFEERYTPQASGSGPYGDVRYWDGVRYVRISSAGPVAVPGTSYHETGLAADVAEPMRSWVRDHGHNYGWHLNPYIANEEPWHFEYDPDDDTYEGDDMPELEKTHRTDDWALKNREWHQALIDNDDNLSFMADNYGDFITQVHLAIDGLPVGKTVQARLIKVAYDKGEKTQVMYRYETHEVTGTDGTTFMDFVQQGGLEHHSGDSVRLRVEVISYGDADVKVTDLTTRTLFWRS